MRPLVLVWLAGCGRLAFDPLADARDGGSAGDSTVVVPTCSTYGTWSSPIEVPTLTSAGDDWEPALHPDGNVLVFNRDAVGLFTATRTGSVTFTAPTQIAGTDSEDRGPAWNGAGDRLYFTSLRSGALRLWYSDYANGAFQSFVMDPDLAVLDILAPSLRSDELELYWTEDDGTVSVHRAERASKGEPWTPTGEETQLVAPGGEGGWSTLSSDGLTMYFEGFNADGPKVYVATRTSIAQRFGTPTLLTELNVSQQDDMGDPEVSRDGLTLMSSFQPQAAPTRFDIYISTRACLD